MAIYTCSGYQTNTMTEITEVNPFDWLSMYVPKTFKGHAEPYKKNQAEYFISGSFEANKDGQIVRKNENLIRRDLLIFDYDQVGISENELKQLIHNKLKQYNYILYPSISNRVKGVRYRLVIQPSRPLIEYEYKHMLKLITDEIGLPIDTASLTWSQLMALPVHRENVKDYEVFVNSGSLYPIPDEIPKPKRKHHLYSVSDDIVVPIEYETAITMLKDYVDEDAENLTNYDNALSAIAVMAKAVMVGEIDENTAIEGCSIIAMGDTHWADGNLNQLYRFLDKGQLPRTPYSFKAKFHDVIFSEIDTMEKLKQRLHEKGEEWRIKHTEITQAGKTRIDSLMPYTASQMLIESCDFRLIGDRADKALLSVYDYDTGLYVSSELLINQLIKTLEPRYNFMDWKKVREHIRLEVDLVKPLKDRYLIPVNNGVFDLRTKKLRPFSPDYYIMSKISTNYNPDANKPKSFDIDAWFNSIACDDDEIVILLWQLINEAINPNYTREKIGILLGSGANGKGTFQKLLTNLIGEDKISALKPDEFGERFKVANLIGKVANIGDDVNSKFIDDVSNLMSISTGDTINVEEKGQPAYDVTLNIFCLFSGNDLPKVRNKSQGWYRRMLIVPFNAEFNGESKDMDIKNIHINSKDVLEYVLKKAIELDFEKFIEPKAVLEAIEGYKKENDPIAAYVEEVYIENGYSDFERVPVAFIRDDINHYLDKRRVRGTLKYHFVKDFLNHLNSLSGEEYEAKPTKYSEEYINELPWQVINSITNPQDKAIRSIVKITMIN